MDNNQEFTFKYWIGHNLKDSDVFLNTVSKDRRISCELMEKQFGKDWFMDESLSVDLFEIKPTRVI